MKTKSSLSISIVIVLTAVLLSACGGSPGGASSASSASSGATILPLSGVFEVTTLAGNGTPGFADGSPAISMFNYPSAVTVDGTGNVYVADTSNQVIRKISANGVVSTYAGQVGQAGFQDGPANTAMFWEPSGLVLDASGNLYVSDSGNARIRKITPTGDVSTYAGSGDNPVDPSLYQNGPALEVAITDPRSVAIDNEGNVYVIQFSMIRKISVSGQVTTVAGIDFSETGGSGFADCNMGSCAKFSGLSGTAFDKDGNAYLADAYNQRVRKITPEGVVSTFAGSGVEGYADGEAQSAMFSSPFGIAVDSKGNVYVSDQNNRVIRKITQAGVVSTVAGQQGVAGNSEGLGIKATFKLPSGLAIDKNDNLYVADYSNHSVRKLTLK